ncbi:MAG: dihydrofolate reductase [Alphaproteobacteria bacterium 64-11]|nr:2-hydroxyacid dehydrogenase [Alphaproteobacteria bacterium]OJU07905.1 MAG: dihydrofolate reductase [Alphaproteobacteria bacterium 64-11]
MTIDILQFVPLRPEVQRELEARYRVHGKDRLDEVASIVRGVVTNGHSGPPPHIIDRLAKLEVICSASVGYDGIPVEYARSKGIPVTNTPEVLNDDVADLAIALMIMTARRLVASDRYVRSGQWPVKGEYPLASRASGKTVGILGMGRIGREIGRRAEAMNNRVAYHSRRPVAGVSYDHYPDLVALANDSDFLIVIIPSTPETQKIVSKEVIEALGPSGILVNVARGAVVDEDALVDALVSGRLGGAGLDVFANEPQVPEVLFGMDNVVLQPHVGSATHETRRAMSQLVLDNLDAHFAGRPLLTEIK